MTYVVIPLAILLGTAISEWRELTHPASFRELLKRNIAMIAMFVASVLSNVAWIVLQQFRGTVSYSVVENAVTGFAKMTSLQAGAIGSGFENLFMAFQPFFVNAQVNSPVNVIWGIAAFGVIIGIVCLSRSFRP